MSDPFYTERSGNILEIAFTSSTFPLSWTCFSLFAWNRYLLSFKWTKWHLRSLGTYSKKFCISKLTLQRHLTRQGKAGAMNRGTSIVQLILPPVLGPISAAPFHAIARPMVVMKRTNSWSIHTYIQYIRT